MTAVSNLLSDLFGNLRLNAAESIQLLLADRLSLVSPPLDSRGNDTTDRLDLFLTFPAPSLLLVAYQTILANIDVLFEVVLVNDDRLMSSFLCCFNDLGSEGYSPSLSCVFLSFFANLLEKDGVGLAWIPLLDVRTPVRGSDAGLAFILFDFLSDPLGGVFVDLASLLNLGFSVGFSALLPPRRTR